MMITLYFDILSYSITIINLFNVKKTCLAALLVSAVFKDPIMNVWYPLKKLVPLLPTKWQILN